ncbi:MAG: FtsW/RodA/SpoVE family cell cycle protein [Clostridia bacterium]|nr:FtsW/RodA/SpoVE family cell cycle protein [Clostridia bacterium]
MTEVCAEIRCKKVHPEIQAELLQHIDALVQEYESQGYSQESAIEKAILAMGDASEIGQKLHKEHKPQLEWRILFLTAAVSIFGVLLLLIPQHPGRFGGSLEQQLLFMGMGATVIFGMYFFDYTKLKQYPIIFYAGSILLIFLTLKFGSNVSGVRRFMSIGHLQFYVPGIAMVCFLLSFCGFLEKLRNKGWMGIWILLLLAMGSGVMMLLIPAMSEAVFLAVAYVVILLLAVRKNHFSAYGKIQFYSLLCLSLVVSVSVFLILIVSFPYRLERLFAFVDKGASDPMNSGWIYQICHKILVSSRWIGKANPILEGDISWVMPDNMGGFALLNLIGNYGWLVGILAILIVCLLIFHMIRLGCRVKYTFGKHLCYGCSILLSLQFICGILMNLVCFPLVNVSLPFISFGGSMYLINSCMIGLILSVWRQNKLLWPEPNKNPVCETVRKRITYKDHKLIIDFGFDETK